jgi:puromycin-sensitive aminopeptidase
MGSVSRSSKEGRNIAWKYLQDNFERLEGMLAKASPPLTSAVVVMCAGGFASDSIADEIETFFVTNPLPNCALSDCSNDGKYESQW